MVMLFTKVKMYLEENSKTWEDEQNNIELVDDGVNGESIKTWNVDGLTKPSNTKLSSYETVGKTVEKNAGIDATRRSQYGSWESQLEMLYKDQKNGTSLFKDHNDKVRTDNPK